MHVVSRSDDVVLSCQLTAGAVRGRLARLGASIDTILRGHDYPPAVAALLAETTALAVVLAGALKYEGRFILQAQGDGPVPLLVADVSSDGDLRGYARFDDEKLAAALAGDGAPSVPRLIGSGYLAFTVDQGADTDRYQGIVELTGATLADCAHQYFRKSEQIETAIKIAVRPPQVGQGWRATGLMLQRMPASGAPILLEDGEEAWRRAVILMSTATAAEMVDPELPGDRLLWRLFHEEGVVVSALRPLRARCRCSSDRVETTLRSFPRAEIESMKDEHGRVVVTCEFCMADYVYADADLDRLYAA